MSRTHRALPHNISRNNKTREEYVAEWAHVHDGSRHAHSCYRWNQGLGRDGGYRSGVYPTYKHAPKFICKWRDDACHNDKRHYKRELAQLVRREGKKIIERALLDMGDDAR